MSVTFAEANAAFANLADLLAGRTTIADFERGMRSRRKGFGSTAKLMRVRAKQFGEKDRRIARKLLKARVAL